MLHSNAGELYQLFSTFNRVWGAGGAASLSLKTVDGKVSALLEVQLSPPADLRPGAPEAHQQAAGGVDQQLGKQHRRRQRGPGRQARDAARQEAWRKRRLESQPARQLPPIPAVETPADNIVPSPVKSPEKQNDPGQPVRKPFKCEQCDFSSDTKHGLSVHNGKAHRPEPASERLLFICDRCEEFFYTSDNNYQTYCDLTIVCKLCDSWIITTDVCCRINNLFIVSN